MTDLSMVMVGLFVFSLGASWGSFANVCIYRMPRGRSVVKPRSRCPRCRRRIPWHDNIPILSFALLRGRCRSCRSRIAWRYPLVEMLTGLVWVILVVRFGWSVEFVVFAAVAVGLVIASFIDFEHQVIPDEVSLGGLLCGILASVFYPPLHQTTNLATSLWASVMGAAVGAGSLYGIGVVGRWIFKREAMGLGDVKLLAMLGSFLGWRAILLIIMVASLVGSVVGLVLRVRRRAEVIPFGPYLSLGGLVAMVWGGPLMAWYAHVLGGG